MAKMIAKRSMTYAHRRMTAGDAFTAPTKDARVLNAIGRATYATRQLVAEPQKATKPKPAKPTPSADMGDLRAQYQEIIGKRPFHGWDAAELQKRIDEALA